MVKATYPNPNGIGTRCFSASRSRRHRASSLSVINWDMSEMAFREKNSEYGARRCRWSSCVSVVKKMPGIPNILVCPGDLSNLFSRR